MVERTTIPEILGAIFAKLETNIPQDQPNITLLQAWTETLGGNGRSSLDVVVSISQVCSLLIKLEAQIRATTKLKEAQKRSALNTTNEFQIFFRIERFPENAQGFRKYCDENHRGSLELIGHSLASEFSEPKLEEVDANYLAKAITEIKELLKKSEISLDLRLNLAKHLDVMLWWLSRPDVANIQDLYETIGAATAVAIQIKAKEPESFSTDVSTSNAIFGKISGLAKYIGDLVVATARGVHAGREISVDLHHMIGGTIPPT